MTGKIPAGKNKLQEMRDRVKDELTHIPRGTLQQNQLRFCYFDLRMYSLGKNAKGDSTKEDVLKHAIEMMKKDESGFKPRYDTNFFELPKNED